MPEPVSGDERRRVEAAIRHHLQSETRGIRKAVGPSGRQVFFVRLPDREVVLKLLNVGKARAVGCGFAVDGLRQAGVATPEVLAVDRTGRHEGEFFDYPFLIMERAEGMPMNRWLLEHKPNPDARSALLRKVGESLRRIHSVPVPSGYGPINDEGVGRFGSWYEFLETQHVRRASGELAYPIDTAWLGRGGLLPDRLTGVLDRLLSRDTGAFPLDEARLVHNDLTLKHIFVDPAELEVTSIIDLHNALAGDPALDLARFGYFYRGRGYLRDLRRGYGEVGSEFEARRLHLTVFVLLEKINWLRGRESRFPGRLEDDLTLLAYTLEMVARADGPG